MKRVLLVGELNKTVSNLNRYLLNKFSTQMCTDSLELIKGMVKVSEPDLIIICLVGVGRLDNKILDYFRNMEKKVPVLLIGTGEECRHYSQYYNEKQFDYVVRPITQLSLLLKCNQILGVAEVKSEEYDWGIDVGDSRRRQILVIDDSSLALRSIKSMLDKKYDITVSMSGNKGLAQAKKILPDLILLDYEMPGWDGKKTFEELRKDEETADIPVVFLTGVADKDHITAVLALNPQGYFLKPVEREKLLAAIDEIFGE